MKEGKGGEGMGREGRESEGIRELPPSLETLYPAIRTGRDGERQGQELGLGVSKHFFLLESEAGLQVPPTLFLFLLLLSDFPFPKALSFLNRSL